MMRQVALIMSCVALLLVGALAVAGADQKVELYAGSPDQVDLAPWGAGAVEQTDEELYLEAETLRVDTKGFYEGGRLDLKSPMDMNAYLSKPEGGYVLLMVKPAEPKAAEPGGLIGEEGFMPGEEFPMPPGAETMETEEMLEARMMEEAMWEGMPSMMYEEEMMFAPGMEMEGVMPEREAPPPEVQRLRVLLVTDEGELDSGPLALAESVEVVEGWVRVVVPMSAFKGAKDVTGGNLEHIALFGDTDESFYVAQLVLGQEDAPLLADAGENLKARVEEDATFTAKEQPGGVKVNYTWDFDDTDGIGEDGYGSTTKWTFLAPGHYNVTLTVSDPADQRVPRTDRIHVQVEE